MKQVTAFASLLVSATFMLSTLDALAVQPKAQPAAAGASAARIHHDADATKAKLQAAKDRGTLMSGCQKKAAEANLHDLERKEHLTACMAGR